MVFVDTATGRADWILPHDTHFAQLKVKRRHTSSIHPTFPIFPHKVHN